MTTDNWTPVKRKFQPRKLRNRTTPVDVNQLCMDMKDAAAEIKRLKIENNERVCKLLAQIVAMRAEIERLTAECDHWKAMWRDEKAYVEGLRMQLRVALGPKP